MHLYILYASMFFYGTEKAIVEPSEVLMPTGTNMTDLNTAGL